MLSFKSIKTKILQIFFAVSFLTIYFVISAGAQILKTRDIDLKGCIWTYRQQSFVIKDEAAFLKEIRNDLSRDRCLKDLEKIDFDKHTLVGIELNTGYCDAPLLEPVQVVKTDAEKKYIVKISYLEPAEPCRALSQYDLWLLVPKLPDNYTVKFEVKGKPFRRPNQ
jgi:hypothetical protein